MAGREPKTGELERGAQRAPRRKIVRLHGPRAAQRSLCHNSPELPDRKRAAKGTDAVRPFVHSRAEPRCKAVYRGHGAGGMFTQCDHDGVASLDGYCKKHGGTAKKRRNMSTLLAALRPDWRAAQLKASGLMSGYPRAIPPGVVIPYEILDYSWGPLKRWRASQVTQLSQGLGPSEMPVELLEEVETEKEKRGLGDTSPGMKKMRYWETED